MPGLVAMDASKYPGDFRLLGEGAATLKLSSEDHANRGIKGRDRSQMQPDIGLRHAIIEAEQSAAQFPIRCGRRQRGVQSPQQPLMDQLFLYMRASPRRAASSSGEPPRCAKASAADSSPQAKTCSSSESASA